MVEPIDFSKTQRIVLVIDLHPLLAFQDRNLNPNPYLTTVLAAAKRLLNFAPLSDSLFALKFFFSSLSPIRSASEVHRLLPNPILTSLSFNNYCQTLTSLSTIFNTLSTSQIVDILSNAKPCASHVASSLLQLVHDYTWESESDNFKVRDKNDLQMIRSSLIILFSPICRSIHALSKYLEMDTNGQELSDLNGILFNFCNIFAAANDVFVSKDIHCSWVDVRCELKDDEVKINDCETHLLPILSGIRKLGWGYCSTDTIILGSALIPFGLIYPVIGVSFKFVNLNGLCERSVVQLSLGILDVNGKTLECHCCDLELLSLKGLPGHGPDEMLSTLVLGDSEAEISHPCKTLGNHFLCGMTKLCIKAVQRYNEGDKIERCSSEIILVQEFVGESKKPKRKPKNDFFAEKVLHMLSGEANGLENCNTTPIWQILLSFLYKEGYWALVSLSNRNGLEALGMLKPLTAHSALLSIISNDYTGVHGCIVSDLGKIHEIHEICADSQNSNGLNSSQSETSTSGNCEPSSIGKKKKKIKHLSQDLTWSSFCKAASEYSEFDLATIYFARYFDKKKLKFLKCWMKQIIRHSENFPHMLHGSKYNGEASILPNSASEPSRMQDGPVFATSSEASETFLNSLPVRIQQGLESGMDIATLAERLVKSSIHSFQALNNEKMELQNPLAKADDACKALCTKVTELLLRDPKEMKDLNKLMDPNLVSERIVREYELQVLLRIEILRLRISERMEEQKMLKQICSFLEIIQYLIDGGIHGNVSLYEYVERTIKTRYHDILEDVVNNIYLQMDLLPFGDENETQAVLFNSEDSSHSWRDAKEMPERGDMLDIHRSVSVEDEPDQPVENVDESLKGVREEEHARKLSEARERRERARRFVSFTSWKPDLQRVWAPKQTKAVKGRPDSHHKDSKRKDKPSARCSVVHETPMTERKRPYSDENSGGEAEGKASGNPSHHVYKALFQDN